MFGSFRLRTICRAIWSGWWFAMGKLVGSGPLQGLPSIPQVLRLGPVKVTLRAILQVLVYDILPSTTVVFSYAIGSRKRSANEQFLLLLLLVVVLKQ